LVILSFVSSIHASVIASSALSSNGFNEEDLVSISQKYPELNSLTFASVKINLANNKSDSSQIELKLYSEKNNDVYVVTKSGKNIEVEKIELKYDVIVKSVEGVIRHTLYESVIRELNFPDIAEKLSESFQDEFTSTKGLKKAAQFQFDIEQYFDHGTFIKNGQILNASLFVRKAISKKTYQFSADKMVWELLPDNATLVEKPFYLPVNSSSISSLFQLNRRHPVTKKHQPHNGIDFRARTGSPVFPALDGEVTTIARSRSKGKYITILHENGYKTTYMHLKKIEKNIKVGKMVELSDQIGEVGRTGFATGTHLHFGIIKDGFFVNPIFLLKRYSFAQKDQNIEIESENIEKNLMNMEISDEDIEEDK
jgi:murein DD-endopeptidase MepM/ murein hydrolase activator NlpD